MNLTGSVTSFGNLIFIVVLFASNGLGQVSYQEAGSRYYQHASEAARAAQWVDYHSRQAWQNPWQQDLVALAWQWKAYETYQRQWAAYYQQYAYAQSVTYSQPPTAQSQPPATQSKSPTTTPQSQAIGGGQSPIVMRGSQAYGHTSLPSVLQRMIQAGNALKNKPYIFGGGHRQLEDVGYDCSSSVSYMLIKAGLLNQVLTSKSFADYGASGPGRYVTLWIKPGHHVFITICGLRFDTTGGQVADGPRWRKTDRSLSGFMPRHPHGL